MVPADARCCRPHCGGPASLPGPIALEGRGRGCSRRPSDGGRCCDNGAATQAGVRRRVYPPVSPIVGLQRETSSDAVVGGFQLRRGDKLWINVMGIHHDPKYWRDPEVPPAQEQC